MPTLNLPARGEIPWDEKNNANLQALSDAIDAALPAVQKGAAFGVAPLGSDSKVPDSNLPARLSDQSIGDKVAAGTPVRYASATDYGMDVTGTSSSRTGLLQAIADTPNGTMLVLPRAARLLVDGSITLTDRDVLIDLNGATLVKGANATLFNLTGGYETPVTVTSYTTGTLTTDEESKSVSVLTLASPAPASWVSGRVLKIVSEDVIPGGRAGSAGNEARLGEYHIISSVSGSTVTLAGLIRESMTTGVRAAVFNQRKLVLQNGFIDVVDAGIGSWTTGIARISSFEFPRISNVRVLRSTATCWNLYGCYGYRLEDLDVQFASDFSGSSVYGYGILDISCAHGYVAGYYAAHVRHGFTDDSGRIAVNSGVAGYGRSYGTVVVAPRIHGSTNSAISTHSYSENQTFVNVDVTNSMNAVGLRGRKHIVRGLRARDVKNVYKEFAEASSDSDSWGHVIENVIADGVEDVAITSGRNPTSGTRDTRPTVLRNFRATRVGNGLADIRNALIQFEGSTFYEQGATVPDGTSILRMENGVIENNGDVIIDTASNTAGASQVVILASSSVASRFTSRGRFRLQNTADHGSRSSLWSAANTSSTLEIDAWVAFTTTLNATGMNSSSRFKYFVNSSGITSEFLSLTSASIISSAQTARISRSREPLFIINTTQNTAGLTMFALPVGSILGQMIIIVNSGTTSFTVANGGNVTLTSGSDTVIAVGGTMRLVWTGTTWRQV